MRNGKNPVWKADSNGLIRETKVQEALKAEYNTDLKLHFALQRRSLAFDQARLVDFAEFEKGRTSSWRPLALRLWKDIRKLVLNRFTEPI